MSDHDPIRWKDADDAPPGMRDVIDRARPPAKMPDDVRAAILAQLVDAPAAPPEPPKPPASFSGTIVVGAVAVCAAVVIAIALSRSTRVDTVDGPRVAPTAVAPVSAEPAVDPERAPAPSLSATAVAPAASSATVAKPKPSARASADVDTLAEESAIVGRARASLVSNPAASLVAIDEHARRFPRGELAPEREYLRVSALRRLGRTDEAKTRGKAFLATYPSSPYAPAVRSLLVELGAP